MFLAHHKEATNLRISLLQLVFRQSEIDWEKMLSLPKRENVQERTTVAFKTCVNFFEECTAFVSMLDSLGDY